jgi:hypothetical protein
MGWMDMFNVRGADAVPRFRTVYNDNVKSSFSFAFADSRSAVQTVFCRGGQQLDAYAYTYRLIKG